MVSENRWSVCKICQAMLYFNQWSFPIGASFTNNSMKGLLSSQQRFRQKFGHLITMWRSKSHQGFSLVLLLRALLDFYMVCKQFVEHYCHVSSPTCFCIPCLLIGSIGERESRIRLLDVSSTHFLTFLYACCPFQIPEDIEDPFQHTTQRILPLKPYTQSKVIHLDPHQILSTSIFKRKIFWRRRHPGYHKIQDPKP